MGELAIIRSMRCIQCHCHESESLQKEKKKKKEGRTVSILVGFNFCVLHPLQNVLKKLTGMFLQLSQEFSVGGVHRRRSIDWRGGEASYVSV